MSESVLYLKVEGGAIQSAMMEEEDTQLRVVVLDYDIEQYNEETDTLIEVCSLSDEEPETACVFEVTVEQPDFDTKQLMRDLAARVKS